MSLNYDLTRCHDLPALQSETEWPITQAIIFETVAVGMGELTLATLPEFKVRSDLWRHFELGDTAHSGTLFTVEDLRKRVGLKTNVFPKVAWGTFCKRLLDDHKRSELRKVARELEALEVTQV